jgi:hypothetical protein
MAAIAATMVSIIIPIEKLFRILKKHHSVCNFCNE